DAKRRSGELEMGADPPFEIALVRVGDVLEGVAVDDDDRRVHATLVRVAQLRPEGTRALWALVLDGLLQQPGQDGRRHLARCRGAGIGDSLPYRREALPARRGDRQNRRELEKWQPLRDRAIEQLLLVGIDRVPFVDSDDDGAAALEDVAGDVRV